jgi:hypothetical protein
MAKADGETPSDLRNSSSAQSVLGHACRRRVPKPPNAGLPKRPRVLVVIRMPFPIPVGHLNPGPIRSDYGFGALCTTAVDSCAIIEPPLV